MDTRRHGLKVVDLPRFSSWLLMRQVAASKADATKLNRWEGEKLNTVAY